MSELRSCQLR